MLIVVYNKLNGEILRTVDCNVNAVEYQYTKETQNYLEVSSTINDSKFYIVNQTVTPRPTFSERISGTTIDNLPIPTTVITNSNSYTVTDGSAELSFSLPGTYKVYLSSFPYQEKDVEVTQV